MTIVLLEPRIAQRSTWLQAQATWQTLPQNMAADLEEMLISRGFVFLGPFRTRDEVVYPERRRSDFFLESEIDIGFELDEVSTGTWRECSTIVCIGDSDPDWIHHQYIDSGTVSLAGRIDFTLVETITANALWRRSYELLGEPFAFAGNTELSYATATTPRELAAAGEDGIARLLEDEQGLVNAVTQALTRLYGNVLTEAARQLDPQGLQREKVIADSLKIGTPPMTGRRLSVPVPPSVSVEEPPRKFSPRIRQPLPVQAGATGPAFSAAHPQPSQKPQIPLCGPCARRR